MKVLRDLGSLGYYFSFLPLPEQCPLPNVKIKILKYWGFVENSCAQIQDKSWDILKEIFWGIFKKHGHVETKEYTERNTCFFPSFYCFLSVN